MVVVSAGYKDDWNAMSIGCQLGLPGEFGSDLTIRRTIGSTIGRLAISESRKSHGTVFGASFLPDHGGRYLQLIGQFPPDHCGSRAVEGLTLISLSLIVLCANTLDPD